MGTEAITQEIPRTVGGSGNGRHGLLPHDAVFATAMARIDALTAGWQEILADFATGDGTGRHAAPDEPAGTALFGITPPGATAPDTATDVDPAVAARAEASRWRRSLAA